MRKRPVLAVIATLLLALDSSAGQTVAAGFVASFPWVSSDPRLGGMSAIEVTDGTHFTALSDRGSITTGQFQRDANGVITGITAAPLTLLKGDTQHPLKKSRADSEGLAIGADGSAYVSFEGVARVLHYPTPGGPAENLPQPREFQKMQINSSLESLAIDARGWLYTMPERSGRESKPFPVYRFRNGKWDQPFTIPRDGTFLAVAADIGPDGRFYVLERQFSGLFGFASRLRRFDLTETTLTGGEVLIESWTGQHDNLEGMSVWRDPKGKLRATMISDDNFRFFQRTEIVEYSLPD